MLSLSQTTGYAVLAMGCIGSWKGDWVRSEAIHECTGVPKPYLRKLLYALGQAGLLETKRGYEGGFVEHYVMRILYPEGLTPSVSIALGVGVVVINVVAYWLARRK